MNGITPDYKVINAATGKDLTQDLRPYLISLSLVESADNQNDTLSISMNGEGIKQFPPSGTLLEIQIGYKETELVSFGVYKVDTKTLAGMPLVLNIKAGATDFTAPIKSQKTRVFEQKKLGDILQTIAAENKLKYSISTAYQNMAIAYLKQEQESDMSLFTRLAKEHSAHGTIKNGTLVFQEKAKSAIVQAITPNDLVDFRLNWVDKPKYDRVIATWHDRKTNVAHEEVFDGKNFVTDKAGNIARTKKQSNNQGQARNQAKAHWDKLHEMQLKASFTLPGNPKMVSKLGLKLQGFIPEIENTILFVKSVRHEISSSYISTIEAGNQSTSSSTA